MILKKIGISYLERKTLLLCHKCNEFVLLCDKCDKKFTDMDEIYCEYENGHPYHSFAHYHLWCVAKEEIDKIETERYGG